MWPNAAAIITANTYLFHFSSVTSRNKTGQEIPKGTRPPPQVPLIPSLPSPALPPPPPPSPNCIDTASLPLKTNSVFNTQPPKQAPKRESEHKSVETFRRPPRACRPPPPRPPHKTPPIFYSKRTPVPTQFAPVQRHTASMCLGNNMLRTMVVFVSRSTTRKERKRGCSS